MRWWYVRFSRGCRKAGWRRRVGMSEVEVRSSQQKHYPDNETLTLDIGSLARARDSDSPSHHIT